MPLRGSVMLRRITDPRSRCVVMNPRSLFMHLGRFIMTLSGFAVRSRSTLMGFVGVAGRLPHVVLSDRFPSLQS